MKTKRLILFIILVVIIAPIQLKSDEPDAAAMKTGYIHMFIKYTQWEEEYSMESFKIGLLGKSEVTELIENYFIQYPLKDYKPVEIIKFNNVENLAPTQFLFVSEDFNTSISEIYSKIKGNNTLLVTDKCEDKEHIMINFMDLESKNKLEVNKTNIEKEQLKISTKILVFDGIRVF